ncbi:PREDICTED: transmembrane protein 161A, partial [Nestor notabilis]|uniref:transmembrane protein 161A n=1 Tax=Nestor notabilis TaxID=176057 RepID=UPI0005238F2D
LRYFLDYQWFVDFAVYSTAVYVFTEGYYCLVDPQKEMNIGVLWCLLTVVFSVKVFFMVMRHYFRSEEGGERSVCLTFAFFFLLLAMVALVITDRESILKQRAWKWTLPVAKLALKLGVLLHGSFLAPVLVVVMWVKPISRDFLLHAPMGKQTVQ